MVIISRFLGVCLIALEISAAYAADVRLKAGIPIYKIRPALLRQGWKPVETFTKFGITEELEHSWGSAKSVFGHGLKEVERCTGVEADYCIFNYRKGDQCLIVFTSGEYIPNKAPKVDDWSIYPVPSAGANNSKPLPFCSEAAWNKVSSSARMHGVPSR